MNEIRSAIVITPADASRLANEVLDEVNTAIVGKRDALGLVLCGVLAGGHVLIEDLPGLGKTLAARSFAQALGLKFTRAQFTPDLLPARRVVHAQCSWGSRTGRHHPVARIDSISVATDAISARSVSSASSAAASAASSLPLRSRLAEASNDERIALDWLRPEDSSVRSARSLSSSSRTEIAFAMSSSIT